MEDNFSHVNQLLDIGNTLVHHAANPRSVIHDNNDQIQEYTINPQDFNNTTGYYNGSYIPSDSTGSSTKQTVITLLISIPILLIIFSAIFGNILVITSVFKFRCLRIISNSFIVSLAFADLLVAVFVMPFSASQEIAGYWLFNVPICNIFNANDVLFSTASLLNICCISMDRYIAISDPFNYRARMSKLKVVVMLTCAWGFSALISHIPIHTNIYTTDQIRNTTSVYEGVCLFEVNFIYALVSSTVSFWIPTTIMVITYILIFRIARRQQRSMVKQLSCVNGSGFQSRKDMRRQHRAARTLGIIMGCFLLCWLPFFLKYVIVTLCGEDVCYTPPWVTSVLFWIGYLNSALNPLIYALVNTDFRDAFETLIKCKNLGCHSVEVSYSATRRYSEAVISLRSDQRASIIPRESI